MKRPVPLYDFTAFGKAIKEAKTKRGESRKNVSDDMDNKIITSKIRI